MLDTFITSFRLKNTYRTNTIIYSIRCLPIIGKLLPASLYGSGGLKTFANVISVLWEIAGTFIGKILYMLLMIMLMLAVYDYRTIRYIPAHFHSADRRRRPDQHIYVQSDKG